MRNSLVKEADIGSAGLKRKELEKNNKMTIATLEQIKIEMNSRWQPSVRSHLLHGSEPKFHAQHYQKTLQNLKEAPLWPAQPRKAPHTLR